MKTAKQSLRDGSFALIQIIESIQGASCFQIQHTESDRLKELVMPPFRVFLISSALTWLYLSADVLENESEFMLVPDSNDYPDLPEMITHVQRTLTFMESIWPHETSFSKSCIFDLESAKMAIQSGAIPGGMNRLGALFVLDQIGSVSRQASPATFFPKRSMEPCANTQDPVFPVEGH